MAVKVFQNSLVSCITWLGLGLGLGLVLVSCITCAPGHGARQGEQG